MREIKFRAWDKHYKKILDWSWFLNNEVCEMFDNEDIELMQYTGLKDKNGKDIYCGDVLKNEFGIVDKIIYFQHEARFGFGDPEDEDPEYLNKYLFGINYEIIGNKFENPELIK